MKTDSRDVSDLVSLSIDRDGRWFCGEQEIIHPKVLKAFQENLRCDASGRHFVAMEGETCTVKVADAPFVVVTLRGDSAKGFQLILNSAESVRLDPATLSLGTDGAFYATLQDGLRARFARAAHNLLAQEAFEQDGGYALKIAGRVYRIA